MYDPKTIERAAFERRKGRVGPEMFVGSYIGPRVRDGRRTNDTCVVALVRRKVTDHERICESCRLHELRDHIGADIDVHPVGRPHTAGWDIEIPVGIVTKDPLPILCGTSIGVHLGATETGTYGALVLGKDDKQYMLSNNHILAGVSGTVDVVKEVGIPVGSQIFHPGPVDDKGSPVPVARLADPVPMLRLSSNPNVIAIENTIDAAKAEIDPAGSAQFFFHFLSGAIQQQPLPLSSVFPGMAVRKVGRTTGDTLGEVIGVVANSPPIGYPVGTNPFTGQPVNAFGRFSDVLAIRNIGGAKFSNNGDSGSAIITTGSGKPQVIALLFSGGTDPIMGDVTYAIPIEKVLTALDIARFINDE
jgi:hypothetical protein